MRITGVYFFLVLNIALCLPNHALGAAAPGGETPQAGTWTSTNVQHTYGLPDTKPKQKGKLTVNADGLTFTGKSSAYTIPRSSIIAVSSGNERVELWGMKGRILRMAIPNGGGLAAAGVMHHKVNMLTVEFNDVRAGYHGAVFYLSASDAERILASFSQMPPTHHEAPATLQETPVQACLNSAVNPRSVLVAAPVWDHTEVPAAYRALVYEHIMDRMQSLDGIGHVYREGEDNRQYGCPERAIRISIASFKQGSQVKRAVMGPVGFFVGTTQMSFNANITDVSGQLNVTEQLKATVRGESESKNVADSVAKKLAKRYSVAVKNFEKVRTVNSTDTARLR